MGRELQKRKRRSSRPTVRPPSTRKRPLNPLGNSIIAKNWNKKETLSQNYRRMGLVAKLGKVAGGIDKTAEQSADGSTSTTKAATQSRDPFAIKAAKVPPGAIQEARLERDADGKVVRVVHLAMENPLNDLLNQFDEDGEYGQEGKTKTNKKMESMGQDEGEEEEEEWGGIEDDESRPAVIREIEREASRPEEKTVRHQSTREVEWLQRLVDRHGDDLETMARDRKLNPMQQTAADIRRRLKKAGLFQG